MRRIVTLAAACLALAGCTKHSAESFVRANLKDPDSAKFGAFYYNGTTKRGCLTVNARNSMGGFTGDQQVRLSKDNDGWEWMDQQEEAPDDCRSGFADVGMPEPATQVPTGKDAMDQMDRDAARLEAETDQASNVGTAGPDNTADNVNGGPTP